MCGRISQAYDLAVYVETIGWNPYTVLNDPVGPRYNVPPGTRPLAMHRLGYEGDESIDRLFWGYKPATFNGLPVSNARLDKVLADSLFWRSLFQRGRTIVPADGWYEWTGGKPNKQSWYVRPKDERPILMAAISAWHPGDEHNKEHGMAIVTDDAAGGMIDIHDRRPVVLPPEIAQAWIDPSTTPDEAKDLLRHGIPATEFVWHKVTPRMGNSRYDGPDVTTPI